MLYYSYPIAMAYKMHLAGCKAERKLEPASNSGFFNTLLMPLDIGEYDLVELTRNAVSNQIAMLGSARLKFEAPPDQTLVQCDANLVTRVILNLVGNALKFTPRDGEVCVRIDKEESVTRLSVIDTGPGIPHDYHAKIFEKFGQVEKTREVHSTGLGLAFCKLAIEAQGGVISVESAMGHGSTFWFALP